MCGGFTKGDSADKIYARRKYEIGNTKPPANPSQTIGNDQAATVTSGVLHHVYLFLNRELIK
jgi:hypothetical protein